MAELAVKRKPFASLDASGVAFGRHLSPTAPSPVANDDDGENLRFSSNGSAANAGGEDLRFTYEKPNQLHPAVDKPYWQQGNADFHTTRASNLRAALFHDGRVQHELERFYRVYHKDSEGCIAKEEYLSVHTKLAKLLIPDISAEEAAASGEEDWAADADGADRMSRPQLFRCLFELADLYTTTIDGGAAAAFLRKLFRRVTVRYITAADGQRLARPPTAPTAARLQEYRDFQDAQMLGRSARDGAALASTPPTQPEPAEPAPSPASPAGLRVEPREETESEPNGSMLLEREGEAEAEFGWAEDGDIFPLILFDEQPIDWSAVGGACVEGDGGDEAALGESTSQPPPPPRGQGEEALAVAPPPPAAEDASSLFEMTGGRKAALAELRSYRTPPEAVRKTLAGVLCVLGRGPRAAFTLWDGVKPHLRPALLAEMRSFEPAREGAPAAPWAESLAATGGLTSDEVHRRGSLAVVAMLRWLEVARLTRNSRAVAALELEGEVKEVTTRV